MGRKELGSLKHLRRLSLFNTNVTGIGFKELAALKNLNLLELGSPTEGRRMPRIGETWLSLDNLTFLDLTFLAEKITDAGLKELTAVKNLHRHPPGRDADDR